MGFLGKITSGIKKGLGKAVGGVRHLGKQALKTAKGVSGILNFGVGAVKGIAREIESLPVLGIIAKSLLDTPLGEQVKSVFNTAEDINQGLIEAVQIGDKVDKLGDRLANITSSELADPKARRDLVRASIAIGREIQKSKVGKKASKIPVVKNSISKYNKQQKVLQKKLGLNKEDVQKIKKQIGEI